MPQETSKLTTQILVVQEKEEGLDSEAVIISIAQLELFIDVCKLKIVL